jgi:hypothetical protein
MKRLARMVVAAATVALMSVPVSASAGECQASDETVEAACSTVYNEVGKILCRAKICLQ